MLELEKLHKAFRWVKEMKKTPDVLFVVDGIYEEQAVKEARTLKIKSYAILNTNGDDTLVDNCIPANTNSVKSTEFIANKIKDELAWVKVTNTWNEWKIKKMDKEKVSGVKKTSVKKVEEKKEESPKKETAKKAPAKKVEKTEEK